MRVSDWSSDVCSSYLSSVKREVDALVGGTADDQVALVGIDQVGAVEGGRVGEQVDLLQQRVDVGLDDGLSIHVGARVVDGLPLEHTNLLDDGRRPGDGDADHAREAAQRLPDRSIGFDFSADALSDREAGGV